VRRYRLVLLDVDGTLVHCAGAGRRSLERALRAECRKADGDLSALRLDGSTDRRIVREGLALLGRPFSDETCDRVLVRYLEVLEEELRDPDFRVLPGVVEALDALRARRVAYGLCTGNVAEAARWKLRRGELEGYFDWGPGAVGGFAGDGEVRTRLVEAAVRRAANLLGPVDPGEVLVVGDTPLDVEAAHGAGCAALGVATGRHLAADLVACGADHVVVSLDAPEALQLLAG
jgi:phosphoglycolate phosphatase-like HAD superfamily hydrolase